MAQVRRSVSGDGIKLAALGVALGLIGAFAGGSVLSTLLYGVQPTDPLTFVLVPLAFAGVAWLGSYMPAVRASRVDPVIALRAD